MAVIIEPTKDNATNTRTSVFVSRRSPLKFIMELAVLIPLAILFLELLFRICGIGNAEFIQPDLVMGSKHIANKSVTWRMEGFSDDSFNSAGMRDVEHQIAKPSGIKRIALIGDSAVEALQVPLNDTFSRKLEAQLGPGYEVLNFACAGYSTVQELLQFKNEIKQYNPDLTIVFYNRGDAVDNIYKPNTFNIEPRPYGYIDTTGKLAIDYTVVDANKHLLQANPMLDYLRANSRIYGVFSQANLALSINEKLYLKLRKSLQKLMLGGDKSGAKSQSPFMYEPDKWLVTSYLLTAIKDEAESSGSKFALVLFPNTVNDVEFALQQDALQSKGQIEKFAVMDLTPAFKADQNPNRLFLDVHFSKEGNALIADQLVPFVKQSIK